MKSITLAGLLCLSCALLSGQAPPPAPQPTTPPPPVPQAKPQNPAQTNAPVDTTPKDDPDRITFGLEPFYWISSGHFNLLTGSKSAGVDLFGNPVPPSPGQSTLPTLGDINKNSGGGVISFPAGKYNRLDVTFFQAEGSGTSVAPQNLTFFGQTLTSGDFLASSFRIRSLKATWNYLTWPAPPETSKFRIRTLWSFVYTQAQTTIDEPFDLTLTSPVIGTHNIYYPEFGIGGEYVPSRHFYFSGEASGFAFPHRSVIWDAEVKAVVRFGHLEIFGGEKLYHLKTSPQGEEYAVGTLKGPFAGLRLFLR